MKWTYQNLCAKTLNGMCGTGLMFLIHSIVCPLYGIVLAKLQGDPSLGTYTFDSFNRHSSGLNFVGPRTGTHHCSDVCIECQNCHTLKN